jgi:hypothetical protein
MAVSEKCTCIKCKRTLADTKFYTYKDGAKCELCKDCLTMHIDNWDPETFLWILEKFDLPYIESEWNILRDRAYAKDPHKMTGLSVIGKYISKMKLKQFKNYTWADSDRLNQEANVRLQMMGGSAGTEEEQEHIKEAYENGEISEAQYKTYIQTTAPEPRFEQISGQIKEVGGGFPQDVELIDVGADLTTEDKVYLAMKWGKMYSAADWVALEKMYNDFQNSFDIQDAATDKTLMFICKTSLKMDQALDIGDFDTYQKLSKVYDAQMKSSKFTAAQNKDEKTKQFDAIGELVAYCEKTKGAIPEYVIDTPLDIVDKVIDDLQTYTRNLITSDSGLAQQIEEYIKKRERADEQRAAKEAAKAKGLDHIELDDDATVEYKESVAQQIEEDRALLDSELGEEDDY